MSDYTVVVLVLLIVIALLVVVVMLWVMVTKVIDVLNSLLRQTQAGYNETVTEVMMSLPKMVQDVAREVGTSVQKVADSIMPQPVVVSDNRDLETQVLDILSGKDREFPTYPIDDDTDPTDGAVPRERTDAKMLDKDGIGIPGFQLADFTAEFVSGNGAEAGMFIEGSE